jgi:hypothetical protein
MSGIYACATGERSYASRAHVHAQQRVGGSGYEDDIRMLNARAGAATTLVSIFRSWRRLAGLTGRSPTAQIRLIPEPAHNRATVSGGIRR